MEPKMVGKAAHIVERQRGKRFKVKRFTNIQKEAGVCYYLYDKGLVAPQIQHHVIRLYASERKWEVPPDRQIVEICILIQKDFPSFVRWFQITVLSIKDKNKIVTLSHCNNGDSRRNLVIPAKLP